MMTRAGVRVKPDGRNYLNPDDLFDATLMEKDLIVCKCMDTTYGDIVDAVSMGMTSMEEVIEWTNTATACQQCRKLIQQVLDYALEVANPFA